MDIQQRFLTTKEVAELLNLSKFYVRQQVKDGKLKAVDLGNKFLFEVTEIERFIKTLLVE